jgi:hypothetical protein
MLAFSALRRRSGPICSSVCSLAPGSAGRDADHDEVASPSSPLQPDVAVAVVLELLQPFVEAERLILERVGQLVREDQALGHPRREIPALEPLGALGAGRLRAADHEEAARLRIVEGDDLRGVEVDERVEQARLLVDEPEAGQRPEVVLGRNR